MNFTRLCRNTVSAILASVLYSCGFFAGKMPGTSNPAEEVGSIKLPPGFSIEVWADSIENARSMALSPTGTLYVGTRDGGRVYAVVTRTGGHKEVITIASGLRSPNGVAFRDGDLYVAEISRIIKFENIEQSLRQSPRFTIVNDEFPSEEHHGWKFIRFGPDEKLYIPVGVPCNICENDDHRFGSIMRMNSNGTGLEIFARGIRNTVGFDWHPQTNELWFTENGRDWAGEDLPPDELNVAPRNGMHFDFLIAMEKIKTIPITLTMTARNLSHRHSILDLMSPRSECGSIRARCFPKSTGTPFSLLNMALGIACRQLVIES